MPIIATASGDTDHEPCPTGMQLAVCSFVRELGHEHNQQYNNWSPKVCLVFELAELMTDGRPFAISRNFTVSLSEKAHLRACLESWRGKQFTPEELQGFDVERVQGKSCLLNIVEYDKKKGGKGRKIAGISPLMKGMQPLAVVNKEPPKWISEQKAKNDAAYAAAMAKAGDDEPVVIVDEPINQVANPVPPPNMARPPQRLATQGNVPLSQPAKQYPNSPPPGNADAYVDPNEPPF